MKNFLFGALLLVSAVGVWNTTARAEESASAANTAWWHSQVPQGWKPSIVHQLPNGGEVHIYLTPEGRWAAFIVSGVTGAVTRHENLHVVDQKVKDWGQGIAVQPPAAPMTTAHASGAKAPPTRWTPAEIAAARARLAASPDDHAPVGSSMGSVEGDALLVHAAAYELGLKEDSEHPRDADGTLHFKNADKQRVGLRVRNGKITVLERWDARVGRYLFEDEAPKASLHPQLAAVAHRLGYVAGSHAVDLTSPSAHTHVATFRLPNSLNEHARLTLTPAAGGQRHVLVEQQHVEATSGKGTRTTVLPTGVVRVTPHLNK